MGGMTKKNKAVKQKLFGKKNFSKSSDRDARWRGRKGREKEGIGDTCAHKKKNPEIANMPEEKTKLPYRRNWVKERKKETPGKTPLTGPWARGSGETTSQIKIGGATQIWERKTG